MAEKERRVVEVTAYCFKCQEETANQAVYVGDLLKSRRCEQCGDVVSPAKRLMVDAYLDEFFERLCHKPVEMKHKYQNHWLRLAALIPAKFFTKLRNEIHYVGELFGPEKWTSTRN